MLVLQYTPYSHMLRPKLADQPYVVTRRRSPNDTLHQTKHLPLPIRQYLWVITETRHPRQRPQQTRKYEARRRETKIVDGFGRDSTSLLKLLNQSKPFPSGPGTQLCFRPRYSGFFLAAVVIALIIPTNMEACVRSQLCISGSWTHGIPAAAKMERHPGDEMMVIWPKLRKLCTKAPS